MLQLSASRIKEYLSCRKLYHDHYVLRNEQPQNTSALFGSALHKTIEYHYDRRFDKGGDQKVFYRYMTRMLDWWHKQNIEVKEYEPFTQLISSGRKIINEFPWHTFNPLRQELAFELPFTEHTTIRGYIDMVNDGSFVDFKSSKHYPKDLQTDNQFIIYAWAYKQIYHVWPRQGEWYHLRTNERFYFDVYHGDIKRQIEQLQVTAEIIYNDTFEDIAPCAKCKPWCKWRKK